MENLSYFTEHNKRLFFLYGLCSDTFITPQLRALSLEHWLLEHLKSIDYQRVIFYDPIKKIHFLDESSAKLASAKSSPTKKPSTKKSFGKGRVKLKGGPLGQARMKKKATDNPPGTNQSVDNNAAEGDGPKMSFQAMKDLDVPAWVNRWFSEKSIPTALVIRNGTDLLNHLDNDANRAWDSTFAQCNKLAEDNRFVVIFIFDGDTIVPGHNLPHLRSCIFGEDSTLKHDNGNILYVGAAKQDEIKSYLHRLRLKGDIGWSPAKINKDALAIAQSMIPQNVAQSPKQLGSLRQAINKNKVSTQNDTGWQQLRQLKGRDELAENIRALVNMAKHVQKHKQKDNERHKGHYISRLMDESHIDVSSQLNLHIALSGNPGTGKTLLAGIIARIFQQEGVLESGHFIKVTRSDLVQDHVGGTAKRTREVIQRAMGGVLFIDEAYTLQKKDSDNDFGKEAIDELLEAMSDHNGRFSVIIAGYPDKIDDFILGPDANPGLARRFAKNNRWSLPDYPADVLLAIFSKNVTELDLTVDPSLQPLLPNAFEQWVDRRNPKDFGNAGDAINLSEEVVSHAIKQGRAMLNQADFDAVGWQPYFEQEEDLSTEGILQSLDTMVGLSEVKTTIRKLAQLINVERVRNKDKRIKPGHYVFSGNPGTGKTTVARLLGEVFKAFGCLLTAKVTEVKREDLIGAYTGHTEREVKAVFEKSLDGVLFIDEAYQLTQGGKQQDTYGNIAAEALVKFMEDYGDRVCVIVAGYPALMRGFVQSNPGFTSRFKTTLNFADFTPHELLQIALSQLVDENLQLTAPAKDNLFSAVSNLFAAKDSHFGNARRIEQLVDEIRANQADRLCQEGTNYTNEDYYIIEADDIVGVQPI